VQHAWLKHVWPAPHGSQLMVPKHPLSNVPHLPAYCGDEHVYASHVHVPALQVKGKVHPQFRSGSPQPCGTVVPHWLPQLPLGVQQVVRNGLALLGVSAPESM